MYINASWSKYQTNTFISNLVAQLTVYGRNIWFGTAEFWRKQDFHLVDHIDFGDLNNCYHNNQRKHLTSADGLVSTADPLSNFHLYDMWKALLL